jgi:hypothetical protein
MNWEVGKKGKWSGKQYCKLNLVSLIVFQDKQPDPMTDQTWNFQVKSALGKSLHEGKSESATGAKAKAMELAQARLRLDLQAIEDEGSS